MSNISKAFETGKAFMPFFICGDPTLEATGKAIRAAVEAGATVIELNIPFSDPTAGDGSIQKANIRALEGGVTTDRIFDFVRELRRDVTVPFVISGYANVVFSYGADRFLKTCAEIGIDSLIVPDLPFEEREEFLSECEKYGVELIYMLSVTSAERVAMIAKEAKGFLYLMATPGAREQELASIMAGVRANTDVPCIVCLNGTEWYRYRDVAEATDGVSMDAPFVQLLERYGEGAGEHVYKYVKATKKALHLS